MTPEGQVLAACMDYLKIAVPHSTWFRRNVVNGSRHGHYVSSGPTSHHDIWGIWNGVHVEIECKKPKWVFGKEKDPKKAKREVDQMTWRDEVIRLGGISFFVTSLDELIEQMMAIRLVRKWG